MGIQHHLQGTPQGSGVSPILANIYLNELDTFAEKLKLEYDRQDSYRKPQKEYSQTLALAHYWEKSAKQQWSKETEAEVQRAKGRVNELYANYSPSRVSQPSTPPSENQYVRYADDFIIEGYRDQKLTRRSSKGKITCIPSQGRAKSGTIGEKTKITHSAELVRFLGYDLTVSGRAKITPVIKWKSQTSLERTGQAVSPMKSGSISCWNTERVYQKSTLTGKRDMEVNLPRKLINMPDAQIISKFNSQIHGLYNYYRLAANVSALNSFYRIMREACSKPLASNTVPPTSTSRLKICT